MNTDILTEEKKKEISAYLNAEISDAESERRTLVDKWNKWRRQREAEPEQETKDFPWDNASNVCAPLTATNTQTIFASMKAAFDVKKPFYRIEPHSLTSEDQKDAAVLEKVLNLLIESKFHVDLRRVNDTIFYELSSLGLQYVHVPWLVDKYTFKRKNATGQIEQVTVERKNGPVVIPYPPEDVLHRAYITSLQRAPWVALRNRITKHELMQRKAYGQYDDVDLILGDEIDTTHKNMREMENRMGLDPQKGYEYEIFETYLYWDIDDDGIMEDIKIWYEKRHNVILRAEYNNLGVRPVTCFRYTAYTDKIGGIGVCQMCEGMQDATDALLNGGINSTFISSLQMFATPTDSGLGPREEFYPFKQIPMDNPRDFVPVAFPNTLLPNLQMMGFLGQMTDRRTGATNAMSGFPDTYAKTRATASGTMFLAQQGSRMFKSVINGVEETFAEIGSFIMFQLVLNKDLVSFPQLNQEEALRLERILQIMPEELPLRFRFKIKTTDIEETAEAKKQRLLTKAQLYNIYGQQTMGLLQGFLQTMAKFNPQGMKDALQKITEYTLVFLSGSTKMMEDIFKEFETPPEGFLPNILDIQRMLELINLMKEQQYGSQGRGGFGQEVPKSVPEGITGPNQPMGGTQYTGGPPGTVGPA